MLTLAEGVNIKTSYYFHNAYFLGFKFGHSLGLACEAYR